MKDVAYNLNVIVHTGSVPSWCRLRFQVMKGPISLGFLHGSLPDKATASKPFRLSGSLTAIGDTIAVIAPYSAIPSKGQLELRYPMPLPPVGCDRGDCGEHSAIDTLRYLTIKCDGVKR